MKIGNSDLLSVAPVNSNLPEVNDLNMEVEEEDEEDLDVDFNPFLREDTPSEASSSLSSENKGPSQNVEKNCRGSSDGVDATVSSKAPEEMHRCEDEEIVMQITDQERNDFLGTPLDNIPSSSIHQGEQHGCAEGCDKDLLCRSVSDADDEDAICKRTRARHSLANYTLEELETFLQESDDDGDLPNVDDEEEYRKFLAAVLVGGTDDEKDGQDDNVEEDEENDADFELEIEEALESDADENLDYEREEVKEHGDARIPVTRQKKHMKESAKNSTHSGKPKILPLCPLLPHESNAHQWKSSPKGFLPCSDIGFTAQQIGQLLCLIHEHVQLLVQVFSVSILDPSSQHVATEVQKMLVEMTSRREEALGMRKIPFPGFCFHPPNLYSSRQLELEEAINYSYWLPLIDNPVLSIIDVAPLRLVKSFITDVSDTVVKHRRSLVDVSNKAYLMKEPLFPLPILQYSIDTNKDTSVDGTKMQSVVLVPKDIARSAQRFYPLFNAALFPHKPPVSSIANRVLFTNAEDGLLAMGLMEYNNDWEAIQQRFLPCKSKHQIFVRQKNRSSSRAPENPIKAVRRMKTSPLTAYEIARISEGLKLFKHDWLSVCKYFVPHRDPSLLPRQWRIANGTQKSYKLSEAKKQKRRLSDAKRRGRKPSLLDCHTSSEVEVDNIGESNAGDMDGEDEPYVHEAFMAETAEPEPRSSKCLSYINRCSLQTINLTPYKGSSISEPSTFAPNRSGHGIGTSSVRDVCSPFPHAKQPTFDLMARVSKPCQTRKSKGAKIVKLAPDLPPVNLPSSVRVISRSTFTSFINKPPSSKTVGNAKGSGSLLKPQERLSECGHEAGNTPIRQFGSEDNTSESDLQMHPLLFQTHENQLSSYFSTNCHGTGSGIYNFFPGNPAQSDLNLLRPQYPIRSDVHHIVAQRPPKAYSTTIDFHPLLQRIDNENENNLDLDIRLSSTSNMEKTSGRDVPDHNVQKTVPKMKRRRYSEVPDTDNLLVEACSQGVVFSLERLPSNKDPCQWMGNLNDDSMAGIVMEQEELSDSDEEIEDVEFECEEIDDSEGDEMEAEQPLGVHDKEKGNRPSEPFRAGNLKDNSVSEGENHTNSMQASQVCSNDSLRPKPICNTAKRNKKKSSDSSNAHCSQTIVATSRKPRKRSQ